MFATQDKMETEEKKTDGGDSVEAWHCEGSVAFVLPHMSWLPSNLLVGGRYDEVCMPTRVCDLSQTSTSMKVEARCLTPRRKRKVYASQQP